jgi:hypothetical protein
MLKRLLLALLLFAAAGRAAAIDFTDIWYLAAESGWGVNVVQSDNFMFVTFFIYGADGKPTWYTAQLTLDASGNYNGPLLATTGTYYLMPWIPSNTPPPTQVGTASFQPIDASNAKLIYIVTGVGTVTKVIQRQTLTTITIGGAYSGAQTGAYSSCTAPSYRDFFDLQLTQGTDGSATFTFSYTEGLTCTFSGRLMQQGQLYSIPSASYQCSDGNKTTATMTEIKATAQGVEGKFTALAVGGGCREDAQFSGVLQ